MKKFNKLSNGFFGKIIETVEGKISTESFDQLINRLELECKKYHFTSSSESNLIRVLNSVYDKTTFLNELIKYPHHIEILIAIVSSSNYLTDIIVRNPEFLYQVFDQNYLSEQIGEKNLSNEIANGLSRYKSFSSKVNFLRQIKKRYILKIGLTDILNLTELEIVTNQLSILARTLIASLFDICYSEIFNKYNLSIDSSKYCLCSLGKLGGSELNYSSDVDLLLFYESNKYYSEVKKEYHEILSEVALLFIKSSSEISEKGYIYRIDFRLRPDGKYSPLCQSITDYIKYYETRGEDWERQMLLKLGYVGGSYSLYNQFLSLITPFIFPKSFSVPLFEQIAKIKTEIEKKVKSKENVKLFKGGIRDIEFSIQVLQLINGGKLPDLRTGNSIVAISKLFHHKLITSKEKNIFSAAYIFYRLIEHFLQLMNDTQTHVIPEEGEILEKLSYYLGFNSVTQFRNKLNYFRREVRKIYETIFKAKEKKSKLYEIKFSDRIRAEKNLNFLRTGFSIFNTKEFDSITTKHFIKVEPLLTKYLSNTNSPDRVLENLVKIIRGAKIPSIWYVEFADKKYFSKILLLCEYSSRSIETLITDPFSADLLLTRKVFTPFTQHEFSSLSPKQVLFVLAVQFTLGVIRYDELSEFISNYISFKIVEIINQSKLKYKFFIAGLGSFATNSMTFSSDVDLLAIVDDVEKSPEVQKDFQNIVSSFQQKLSPFRVDFRLRPEGKSSQLVWDIQNFKSYLQNRARVWEFQALSKIKFITGNINLFNLFENIFIENLCRFNNKQIKTELVQMHKSIQNQLIKFDNARFDLKKENGGLITIDFLLSFFILCNKLLLRKVLGKNFTYRVNSLSKVINAVEKKELLINYQKLKFLELSIQNIFNCDNSIFTQDKEINIPLYSWLNRKKKFGLIEELKQIKKRNILLFEKYVNEKT